MKLSELNMMAASLLFEVERTRVVDEAVVDEVSPHVMNESKTNTLPVLTARKLSLIFLILKYFHNKEESWSHTYSIEEVC